MKVIAKKYLNRFWLDNGVFTSLGFIVPAIFFIIYVKDNIWVHVAAYSVIAISLFVSIYIKLYNRRPIDILTYEEGIITYHQTKIKKINIRLSDITSISSNQFRHKSSYNFGSLFIETAEKRYTLNWISNLSEVEETLRELIDK